MLTILGNLFELGGLVVTVIGLALAWRGANGTAYQFLTGAPLSRTYRVQIDEGIDLSDFVTTSAVDPLTARVDELTLRLDALQNRLPNEISRVRAEVVHVDNDLRAALNESAAGVRLDVRLATLGVAAATFGVLLQIVDVIFCG